jgi:flagellar motility protein MotE (MotC chaperone)
MKYKLLVPLAALKVVILVVWFLSSYLSSTPVHAQTQVPKPVLKSLVTPEYVIKSNDEEAGMIEAIKRRQVELDDRDEMLKVEEERLEFLKGDIEKRISELNEARLRLDKLATEIEALKSARAKKTVKIYESMAPEEAASRIERLNEGMAVMILANMNAKKAGAILGLVEIDKAVLLTHKLKIKVK